MRRAAQTSNPVTIARMRTRATAKLRKHLPTAPRARTTTQRPAGEPHLHTALRAWTTTQRPAGEPGARARDRISRLPGRARARFPNPTAPRARTTTQGPAGEPGARAHDRISPRHRARGPSRDAPPVNPLRVYTTASLPDDLRNEGGDRRACASPSEAPYDCVPRAWDRSLRVHTEGTRQGTRTARTTRACPVERVAQPARAPHLTQCRDG